MPIFIIIIGLIVTVGVGSYFFNRQETADHTPTETTTTADIPNTTAEIDDGKHVPEEEGDNALTGRNVPEEVGDSPAQVQEPLVSDTE